MKSILNKIFKIISTVIFVILVISIIAILGYVLRVKYLASTGRLGDIKINFYTILTQSMVPTIYAGDVIVTYRHDDNKYEIGDILTYRSDLNGGINITHRIKESYIVNGKYSYKTKGDNNSIADSEIVKGERVLGKVILKIPKVGYFQQYLVKNRIIIIGVLLASLSVVIYDVVKVFEGARRKKEDDFSPENDLEEENDNSLEKIHNELVLPEEKIKVKETNDEVIKLDNKSNETKNNSTTNDDVEFL